MPVSRKMILEQEAADLRAEGAALLEKAERMPEEQERLEVIVARAEELREQIAVETRAAEALRAGPAVLRLGRGDDETRMVAHYLRTGDPAALGLRPSAAYNDTDMNIATPADGGYAVPTGMYNGIISRRDELALYPRLGVRGIPGQGLTVNVPIDDEADVLFTAVTEANSIGRDAPALNQKAFTLVKYAKKLQFSWELLRDEDAAVMAFVNDWIGRGIAATENSLLVTEVLANGTAGLTLDAAAAIGAAEIAEFVGKLAPEYQDGAAWLLKNTTVAYIQGLNSDVTFHFAPAATGYAGRPSLWGYPVYQSSACSAVQASAKSLVFGNFFFLGRRQGTTIQMLRDPYTAAGTGQITLWFWFDCVYGVLQAEAIQYATHPTG